MAKHDESKSNQISGTIIAGSAMIGVGVGFLVDQVGVGAVLGAGVGFVLAAVIRAVSK